MIKIKSITRQHNVKPKKLTQKILAVIDTDSTYLSFDEIHQNYTPELNLLEFVDIMEPIVEDFFVKILTIKAEQKGMPQVIDFKREGVITKQFVLAKKKYLTELLKNEDDVFDPPYIKATGVEIKRSDTPAFCREWISNAVQDIFDNLNQKKNHKLIKQVFKDFKKQEIDKIASIGSVKEYTKYADETSTYIKSGLNFKSGTPMRNKAAICYNYVIQDRTLPYMPISNGSKIKYIRVNPRNLVDNEAIAWVGNYPEEFKKLFKINYEEHYNKTFLSVLNRMWVVLGWIDSKEIIPLKTNKLSGFIS